MSRRHETRMKVVLDMETGDPDDILTLVFLARHPAAHLRALTLTPGTREQVSIVQWILQKLDVTDVRIGAQQWPQNADKKMALQSGFYASFGRALVRDQDCELASTVLCEECDENTTLLTCGPLHNLESAIQAGQPCDLQEDLQSALEAILQEMSALKEAMKDETLHTKLQEGGKRIAELKRSEKQTLLRIAAQRLQRAAKRMPEFTVGRWVAQGGFASGSVVPPQCKQLPKFAGLDSCSTWNFGGNIPAAHCALQHAGISRRVLVSKNVCHQVVYDGKFHQFLGNVIQHIPTSVRNRPALEMVHSVMSRYLAKKPGGKKMHDPLALCVVVDEMVVAATEIEMFTRNGEWGCICKPGSNTFISVDWNPLLFAAVLVGIPIEQCTALLPAGWSGASDETEASAIKSTSWRQ